MKAKNKDEKENNGIFTLAMKRSCLRYFSMMILWGMILLWGGDVCGEERKSTLLLVGYSSRVFVDVDLEDAKAVTNLWTDILTRQSGYKAGANVTIYQDLQTLEKDVKAKKSDLLVVMACEFLEIKSRVTLDPILVSEFENGVYEEMVLLVRKEKNISSFSNLRHKPIAIPKGLFMTTCQLWLETCLMREGILNPKTFFSNMKEVQKPSQAVLQVFFKQVDACIVNRNAFTTMIELNPQVGKELMPVVTSPGIPGGVVSIRVDLDDQDKKSIFDTLTAMHTNPQGKQLLTFFRKKRLVPFKAEYLRTIEDLVKEHHDLQMRLAKKGQ